jgi:2'-hydroxyisoflavone reductase
MRLLVLGGTTFLGRHVVAAALERGYKVATFTRGYSGRPPDGARAFHGDRTEPGALGRALGGWRPELVVDTSGQTRAAARNAAEELHAVRGYAFVSSLNAYRNWPPGPVGREDDEPTWETNDDEYGPIKADSERILARALGDRFLTARAGLIVGPYDPLYRLGWWLDRIARGGRVVAPGDLDQPIAAVDARDLGGWLVDAVDRGLSGAVNATGPVGMTTMGGLLEICRAVTGSDAEFVAVPDEDLLAADVQPWHHLPMWLPADTARTAWDVDTTRARELGLPSRPLVESVADTWAWMQVSERPAPPPGRDLPGLPPELEEKLLAGR